MHPVFSRFLMLAALAALAAWPALPAQDAAMPRLRVLKLGAAAEDAGGLGALLRKQEAFELRGVEFSSAGAADLSWADVVLLDDPGKEEGDGWVEPLRDAVRAGKGLVATAAPAAAFASMEKAAALFGLGEAAAKGALKAPGGSGAEAPAIRVAVFDQKHPITQCVPDFEHHGELSALKLGAEARVLAGAGGAGDAPAGPEALSPLFWHLGHGRGRAVVVLLDHARGASKGLVQTLVLRSLEWAGRSAVSVGVSGEFRLVAETLAADQSGFYAAGRSPKGFFRGRELAPFMSHYGADWLVRPERDEEERPEKVLDALRIGPGMAVADFGAGNGYFALRMARRVGDKGKVIAIEIQEEMLKLLRERAEKDGVKNVQTLLIGEKDPELPLGAFDLVLMVDVYHELAFPRETLAAVRKALKKDGRVVLVEYRGEDPSVPIKPLHRMLERQARAELEALGFRWVETHGFLPRQHVIVFAKRE
jgi:FkbM family methyltransferase